MEQPTQNTSADSSVAVTIEAPSEPKAYAEWRQTGKVPQAESAPATKKTSDSSSEAGEGEGTGERQKAPESETGKAKESKPGKAEARLNELLEDLRRAGLSPAELKSYKREAAKAAETESKPKPEPTAKPVDKDAPKKPKDSDFKTWEEYEAARDEYFEAVADYKAQKAVESDRAKVRQEAAQKDMSERLEKAKARYKDDSADTTIVNAAKEIFTEDSPVPQVIREVLNESDHLVDVLYTLGRDQESLSEFLDLCKTSPGKAMRRAVLIEKLVMEELGSGVKAEASGTPERSSDGKFVGSKRETKAPPPPKETSGRSSAPPDDMERAIESGDFASYSAAANRRDLARRQGR